MEKRLAKDMSAAASNSRLAAFALFSCVSALAVFLASCASLGEPIERKPPVPSLIRDLSAEQSGNDVVLSFTVPKDSVDRRALAEPPAIEIYRTVHSTPPSPPALLVTMPSAVVAGSSVQGRLRYVVSLTS